MRNSRNYGIVQKIDYKIIGEEVVIIGKEERRQDNCGDDAEQIEQREISRMYDSQVDDKEGLEGRLAEREEV